MYLKRDVSVTCYPHTGHCLSVVLYLPADGHSKLHSDATCDTFRCDIKLLPNKYLELTI